MKKRDYILIGCILLVAAVCAGFFLLTGKEAQEAVVTVDGEVYGTYSLAKDQTIEIQDGNRLRIQNGQAKMSGQTVRISSAYTRRQSPGRERVSSVFRIRS